MNGQVPSGEPGRAKVINAALIAVGTVTVAVVTDPPDGVLGWMAFTFGALLLAVVGAGMVELAVRWLRRLPYWRIGAVVLVGVLASGVMWVAKPWIAQAIDTVFVPCAPPAQIRALTTPELLEAYRDLANQFENAMAERDGECRPAEVHVAAMPAPRATAGISAEWSEEYLREAPRPDIWLPETKMHVDEVDTRSQIIRFGPRLDVTDSIGSTPIVLAVPAASGIDPKQPEWTGQTWAALVRQLQAAGIGLVRPAKSTVSEFATVAIYGSEGAMVHMRNNPDRAHAVESWLDSSMAAGQYPPSGSVAALLRRQHELGTAGSAMVISEQDLIRYNQEVRRGARGRGCDAHNGPSACMFAVYPVDTHTLDLPLVLMHWTGVERSAAQQKAATDFKAWLDSADGRTAMVSQRLRPPSGTPLQAPLSEENGVLQGGPVANAKDKLTSPAATTRAEILSMQQGVRKTGRVLISLDASGSMRERVGGQTRYELAVQAITQMPKRPLSYNVFSSTMGVRQVDLASLRHIQPSGNTPQHRALLDGMHAVGQGGVLVLMNDGNNNVNDVSPQQLAALTGVRVLVLAFGEANCGTQVLMDVTSRTGGGCRQASVDTLSGDLASLLGGV
ncbi:substrate-binding domain-containing protein [Kibdelosporangium philippinense]|uniref:Substrate-binding domain-containing protein n=1 Tax=Kibdelosporangium philippinense TaxID=211113 RepID=A0ABS8ZDU2_9PSEU|nr:substrate-binding domain-containing protein [Kibdelosporangium philippinense]MCE7004841.1 substrate-binding domain-containing protein [Kibdelosporangium philippinense]